MPRRKQTTPKKHGEESLTTLGDTNDVEPEQHNNNESLENTKQTSNEEGGNDEILDLSIKKRKSTDDKSTRLSDVVATSGYNQPTATSMLTSNPMSYPEYSIVPPFFPYSMPHHIAFPSKSLHSFSNPTVSNQTDNTLSKLNNLVSKVGKEPLQKHPASVMNEAASRSTAAVNGLNFQELWWRFVKKEENAEVKRINEAKQIFTCLQCQASFQTMDLLVKHMEATRHYANIPKHYSWSLQYARQKMRQMKMKMKYSEKMMYFCFLCQAPFTEPVHIHFNCVHNMHNPVENMKHVHIISMGLNHQSSGQKKKWSRSSSTSTNGSDGSSPSNHLVENNGKSSNTMPSPSRAVDKIGSNDLFHKMEEIVESATATGKKRQKI